MRLQRDGRQEVTQLVLYEESGRHAPVLATDDRLQISKHLATLGFGYERARAEAELPSDADQDFVLCAYSGTIARLAQRGAYQGVDVFRALPDAPDRAALRATFLTEHTHDDDEVRLFVEGGGSFYLRGKGRVAELRARRGDLVRVPAGSRHWFDTGNPPFCTAIRLFTRPDGWVASVTGDAIAGRFAST
jgi:1,2-dihydroxy-3-keto-5-methylthiopentene dioxygenase